jgi:TonB family protein
MPNDPDALYALVLKSQGLNFPGVKPWHIKASYTVFDTDGSHPVNGVFEEWWMGPHKYKRSYSRAGFTQTDYAANAELYRVGNQQWPIREELWIPTDLTEPLPNLHGAEEFTLQKADFTGNAKLRCIALTYPVGPTAVVGAVYPTFCIDPGAPVLRLSVPRGSPKETIYNRILGFQGHYVAGDIQTDFNGKTIFRLTVNSLDLLQSSNDGLFTPPSDALLLQVGTMPLPLTGMRLLKSVMPVYPSLAKTEHFDGVVNIQATIGRDGHVAKAKIVDGPRILQQAALDAVQHWIYRPFMVSGEPVEVDTPAKVMFRLGR